MLETRGFALHEWQASAVESWRTGDDRGAFRGTFEIFTGGGKTLIALSCAAEAARTAVDGFRLAVVVPTEALAHQWRRTIKDHTSLASDEIGLLGAGGSDELSSKRALVCVLNTAARRLPAMVADYPGPTMLVVDECHRAGAPSFSAVLKTPARFRLGLSATPDREELDDDGEPLDYDEQLVGQALGGVVYRFDLKQARTVGWLPEFTVHHHGVELVGMERQEYDRISRQVDDLADRLRERGIETTRARALAGSQGDVGKLAGAYVAATAKRKDLLYRSSERNRVASTVVRRLSIRRSDARILLFHERIDEAVALHENLAELGRVGIEHSRLPQAERQRVLDDFRTGSVRILVSVKSLIEGIDVPAADVGVSVASSSSVRQRVQSLGRVLRRTFDGAEKVAQMHVIYVADSADELIYAKEDWADLTGEAANHYWHWPIEAELGPERQEGPPRSPLPTEHQEWERLGRRVPSEPAPWLGALPQHEYSVDTTGTVRNRVGAIVANTQGVDAMVTAVRGRPGGRFYVTPVHRLVVVREAAPQGQLYIAGQLRDPFHARADVPIPVTANSVSEDLAPGAPFPGPLDSENGEFRCSQKRGGVIERVAQRGVREFAIEGPAESSGDTNLSRLLTAWRSVTDAGVKFSVNSRWDAWYVEAGEPRFLASVPGGFCWPSDEGDDGGGG